MDFILNNPQELIFSIDSSWWSEARMGEFKPTGHHYIHAVREGIEIVDLNVIEPRIRAKGFNRRRLVRILKGFRKESPIPPIEIMKHNGGSHFSYKLIDGFHRFYSSAAVGFTHIPAVIRQL